MVLHSSLNIIMKLYIGYVENHFPKVLQVNILLIRILSSIPAVKLSIAFQSG